MPTRHLLFVITVTSLTLACEPKPQQPTIPPSDASASTDSCAPTGLDEVWTPARRDALVDALREQVGEWPTQALATIDMRVREGGPAWEQSYEQACRSHDEPAQRCLDHELWKLDALLTVVTEDSSRATALWAELDELLRDPATCLGTTEPSFAAPPLSLASGRALAQMRLLLNLEGGKGPALASTIAALELDPLVRETDAYALPVHASAAVSAFMAGRIDEADAQLRMASDNAASLGPRARMSVAHIRALLAFNRGDVEGGLLAVDEAVAAAREQSDPWLLFAALRNLGRVRVELRDHTGAVAPLTEAISISTRLAGSENPHTAEIQVSLARAQLGLGQVEAAHDLLMQARDSFVNTLGPDHPQTLATVESIGQLLLAAGRPLEANRAFLDLLEINETLYGAKDRRTAGVKLEIAETLMAMDQPQSAQMMYLEALTPLVQALGAEHRDVVRTVVHLGYAELALGNLEEAKVHCSRGADLAKGLAAGDALAGEAKACLDDIAKAARKR